MRYQRAQAINKAKRTMTDLKQGQKNDEHPRIQTATADDTIEKSRTKFSIGNSGPQSFPRGGNSDPELHLDFS